MEGFTAAQACRYTGCTPHQLRYWDRIKLVKPSLQATGGRPGVRRLYSFRDLVQLKVVRSLIDGGMSLQKVRRAYDYLRKKAALDDHISSVKLVTDGRSIFQMYRDDKELLDLLKEGQMAFFLAIDDTTETPEAKTIGHLYDRDDFLTSLRRMESELEQQLDPATRERVWATR
ncbi:MAG TPA: MerR family transcriptional regulator [Actinomycetota bacterium]|nr:MerR family transcriptional regulator [Actinomycetota bacterium]